MGRVFTGHRKRRYELRALRPHHVGVLLLVAKGMPNRAIAERVGLSAQQVSNVKCSGVARPVLGAMMDEMDRALIERIRAGAPVRSFDPWAEMAGRFRALAASGEG